MFCKSHDWCWRIETICNWLLWLLLGKSSLYQLFSGCCGLAAWPRSNSRSFQGEMCTGCASPEASWVHFSALLATQTPFLHVDAVEVLPNSIFRVNVVWFITKYCRSLIYADLTFAVSQVVMKMHGMKSFIALLRHPFGTAPEAGVQGWVSHVTSGLGGSPTSPSSGIH